ncbi:hypothetical protein ACFSVJ_06505 [Prauserella oleivorans]
MAAGARGPRRAGRDPGDRRRGRSHRVGAAILGDPRRAFDEAVRLADHSGVRLRAGWVLLAGAATPAEPLPAGAGVRAVVETLGSVSFKAQP